MPTDITLNAKDWRGLPDLQPGEQRIVRMRAVYRSAAGYEFRVNNVWIGTTASTEEQFILSN